MVTKKEDGKNEKKVLEPIEKETRLDEFAVAAFQDMGFTTLLPDSVVETYREFKGLKDKLMPGRLSPGEFAFVCLIAKLKDKQGA